LPFEDEEPALPTAVEPLPDEAARARAIDPAHNVVLEASAGTGKTHVLVERYLNLLRVGIDPSNILAITFTRKAASEMRGRILTELKKRASASSDHQQVWREMRERLADIDISTIDAFCLSLLHEFPLEAGLDPGFDMADETQVPRLMEEALDRALDVGRSLSGSDENVRLLLAELREGRIREGLTAMIDRRLVVEGALRRALDMAPRDLTADQACQKAFARLKDLFAGLTGGVEGFLGNGPVLQQKWNLLSSDMRGIARGEVATSTPPRGILDRIEGHFLNKDGEPRQRFDKYSARDCKSADAWKRHRRDIERIGPQVADVLKGFRRDLNAVLSRGVNRLYQIALSEYQRTLESYGVLDFSETLASALVLLGQMDEFARSRYRLEGRYHHVLVDEFQDTSRAQWALVAMLIQSWGEGRGVAESLPLIPSIFLVGDRKQSIYGFRDADAGVMDDAGEYVDQLRPDHDARRAISKSFRAVPQLLAFANDLFTDVEKVPARRDAFRFNDQDRFPLPDDANGEPSDRLGIITASTVAECAERVAAEIEWLLQSQTQVRDADTGINRPVARRDIGILFRTKEGHQEFEKALDGRHISSYVYKGLGFFEADEIKDVLALLRFLAAPDSNLRAAAFLRSRFVRLSDAGLQTLSPDLALALTRENASFDALGAEDRLVLNHTRVGVSRWLRWADRIPSSELLELVIDETAYLFETRGPRARQARENLKKIRSMIRRLENRGYATLLRVTEHLDRLTAGDESNAVIDAGDAVSLMTIHAAKGLEFPVVFLVNMSKGAGGRRAPIRVVTDSKDDQSWLSVSDFQSEADLDARAKDREEGKRLLYVAISRARDRLYLVSEAKDGCFKPWGGSLGDLLPATLKPKFEEAFAAGEYTAIHWRSSSGKSHTFRIGGLRRHDSTDQRAIAAATASAPHDLDALEDRFALRRVSLETETPARSGRAWFPGGQPELSVAIGAGDALFGVPFSLRLGNTGEILRGTFDCLIRRTDGGVTVLGLKSGKPAPEHQRELVLLLAAARALFPIAAIEGKLIYAAGADLDDRALD